MTSGPTTPLPVAPPTSSRTPLPPPSAAPATAPGTSATASAAPATIRGSGQTLQSAFTGLFQGTPGRMRLLGILGVIAALLLGGAAANAILASEAAAERAATTTEQVVRMQSIQVDLLRADALATNAFLVGGLETADARAQYDAAMAAVARNIAAGAAAQPADAKALGTLAEKVQDYGALVEQARSNNRLGLPVGARYLTEASASLRASAIPVVAQIVDTNEARAQKEFDRSNSSIQLLAGVAALIVLVLIAVWLARRTHRYLNPSLTGGVILLVVGLIVAGTTIGKIGTTTAQVASGDYKRAVDLAHVRTAANDARANESLTLVQRGSGQAYEDAWVANDKTVRETLAGVGDSSDLTNGWDAYATAHKQIRALDDDGQWEQAVELATTQEASGATAAFNAFDEQVTQERDAASKSAIDQLGALGGGSTVWAVLIAIVSLIASWLIVRGIGQRIKEYR
ncbi:hypothetical protein [Intrasporangium sp.]|jgi:hypothetical protein|uniref:hypothetical protein n=1 Tax=Intrasporangium sp. TaxID=1925024 RepID=UPI0033658536